MHSTLLCLYPYSARTRCDRRRLPGSYLHSANPISFPVWAPINSCIGVKYAPQIRPPCPPPQRNAPNGSNAASPIPRTPPLQAWRPNLATRSLASSPSGPNHMDEIPPAARELSPSSPGQCEPCSFLLCTPRGLDLPPVLLACLQKPLSLSPRAKSFGACINSMWVCLPPEAAHLLYKAIHLLPSDVTFFSSSFPTTRLDPPTRVVRLLFEPSD